MKQLHSNSWDKLTSPARPSVSDINTYKSIVPEGPILLLGVTPEIANAYDNVLAVDKDIKMIENVWPGNTETKHAVNSSWESFLPGKKFNGVLGDCAMTMIGDKKHIVNANLRFFDMLNPGGTMAHRIFHKPKERVTKQHLIDMLSKPATINFNAFKWTMFMYYGEEVDYRIKVTKLHKLFNEICPIRELASELTGWSMTQINSIDIYENSDWEVSVLSKKEWLETIPKDAIDVKFTYQDDYDLAELCPILSFSKNV
jgi:hypothetical protein